MECVKKQTKKIQNKFMHVDRRSLMEGTNEWEKMNEWIKKWIKRMDKKDGWKRWKEKMYKKGMRDGWKRRINERGTLACGSTRALLEQAGKH